MSELKIGLLVNLLSKLSCFEDIKSKIITFEDVDQTKAHPGYISKRIQIINQFIKLSAFSFKNHQTL